MWKTFTNACLTAALLAGCASPAWERSPQWERSPDREAAPPPPNVHPRNADAFARATELLAQGRLVEAETLLLEVTDDQPELAGPWINLSQVFLAQAREDDALAALERAVSANPTNCAARTELGVLRRRRGEFAAAEAHYQACLAHDPANQAAYLNLGILYELYLGRLQEALSAYQRYQSLADDSDRRVALWVVDLQRRIES